MSDPASGNPRKVEPNPYAALFVDCTTVEDALEFAAEIAAMEAERPDAYFPDPDPCPFDGWGSDHTCCCQDGPMTALSGGNYRPPLTTAPDRRRL